MGSNSFQIVIRAIWLFTRAARPHSVKCELVCTNLRLSTTCRRSNSPPEKLFTDFWLPFPTPRSILLAVPPGDIRTMNILLEKMLQRPC
ncbi:hypothetical protein AHAS_Ahas11G0110600 [Arachis hypogaea]